VTTGNPAGSQGTVEVPWVRCLAAIIDRQYSRGSRRLGNASLLMSPFIDAAGREERGRRKILRTVLDILEGQV
jgi:hypothetical protein